MDDLLGRLLPILAQLAVADDGTGRTQRAIPALGCALFAAFGAVVAAGCLVTALWLWLLPQIGPVAAPIVCAAVLLLICVGLMMLATRMMRRRKVAPTQTLIELYQRVDGAGLIRDHMGDLLIAAVVAGLVTGNPAASQPRPNRMN